MLALCILTVLVSVQLTEATSIHQTGVCSFRKGLEEIDLSPLAAHPVFKTFTKTEYNHGLREVYWNPCSGVSQGVCRVALCARYTHSRDDRLTSLAPHSSGRLVVESDGVSLQYSTVLGSKVSILLTCSDEEAHVYVDKRNQQGRGNYLMTLSSRHACWKELPAVTTVLPSNTTSNVTVPVPPTGGVVTATATPSDGPAITLLLLIEVLATILILVVLLSGVFVFINHKRKQRRESSSPPSYEYLYLDDDTMIKL